MARKRFTTEQIIRKLREAEVELSKGQSVGVVCKKLGVTTNTYYRWRKEYGGLRLDQAKRLKQLERENTRLKTLLEFKLATDYPLLPARVVGRSASAWYRTLILGKGSETFALPCNLDFLVAN